MALEHEAEAAPPVLIVGYSRSVTTRVGLTPQQQGTFYDKGCTAQCVKTQSFTSS